MIYRVYIATGQKLRMPSDFVGRDALLMLPAKE